MSIETIKQYIKEKAAEFGAKPENGLNKPYGWRDNTSTDALQDNGAYFGFIGAEEETSGPFHDFSLSIFPSDQEKSWLICIGVGINGFKNDYELATYPGLRRLFSKLVDENGFCKSDLSDIESSLPKSFTSRTDLQYLKNTIKKYIQFLPVCQIVENPQSKEGKKVIAAFVAAYAKLRDWPTNKHHRDSVSDALKSYSVNEEKDISKEITSLLKERKYVVLQGPPGTGKTRTAKKIVTELNAKAFFTQFHAETSYSDFIYGIRPNIDGSELHYTGNDGYFLEALKYAIKHDKENVILIIDEINRANLSNVLGPIFYLFEHKIDLDNVEIEISPGLKVSKLPQNFHVIATMNTADRSLAVVDFALRRRFAWYNLKPAIITGVYDKSINAIEINSSNEFFFKTDFIAISEIFNWYATTNELSLQPGQGYFIASSEDEMKNRIRYELLPLIREYLQEGLIKSAKEEFNTYFINRIKESLFE